MQKREAPPGHIQGISESLRQVFPVIQQRPLFFPWRRFPEAGRTNCLCCGGIHLTVSCQSEEPSPTDSLELFSSDEVILSSFNPRGSPGPFPAESLLSTACATKIHAAVFACAPLRDWAVLSSPSWRISS